MYNSNFLCELYNEIKNKSVRYLMIDLGNYYRNIEKNYEEAKKIFDYGYS
jgi:hypothetical protein